MNAVRPHGFHPHRFSLAFALAVRTWLQAGNHCEAEPVHLARWLSGFFHAPYAMQRHLPSHLQEGRFYWRKTRLWLPRAAAQALRDAEGHQLTFAALLRQTTQATAPRS